MSVFHKIVLESTQGCTFNKTKEVNKNPMFKVVEISDLLSDSDF